MLSLFQQHTVDLYHLAEKEYEIKTIPARKLLSVQRFDLFAKLLYIKYRYTDPALALKTYKEHIKAFNPDLKEPGRTDKQGLPDFITAFNQLINYFSENDFDPNISLIPVDENGTILDGSHRLAALAYYNKNITIAQFKNTFSIADFDYSYFQSRGLSVATSDRIVLESLSYLNNLHIACLWPKMGKLANRSFALDYIKAHFSIFYLKNKTMSLEGLTKFIFQTYQDQDWVGHAGNNYAGARDKALNCYSPNKMVQFIIFQANNLEKVINTKEAIRKHYRLDKHALHITDNQEETAAILQLILTEQAAQFGSAAMGISDKITAIKTRLKDFYWLKAKVTAAKFLKKLGIYK